MLNNVCLKCWICSKIEKMGLFLVKKIVNKKCAHFDFKLLLWTYANQRGSVLIFWKIVSQLILIWAFRKKTFQVDLRKSIFLKMTFSCEPALKRIIFYFFFLYKKILQNSESGKFELDVSKKSLKPLIRIINEFGISVNFSLGTHFH